MSNQHSVSLIAVLAFAIVGCSDPKPVHLEDPLGWSPRPTEQIAESTATIKDHPNHAPAYHNRGMAYRNRAKFALAIDDLTRAIELLPDAYYIDITYMERGIAFAQMGRFDEALRDLNEALAIDGTNGRAYYTKGEIYLALNDNEEAYKNFILARQNGVAHPLYVRGSINAATINALRGDLKAGLGEFTILARDYPGDPSPFFARGRVLFYLGDYYNSMDNYLHAFLLTFVGGGLEYRWEIMPYEAFMYEPGWLSWQRLVRVVDAFERWRLRTFDIDIPHRIGL